MNAACLLWGHRQVYALQFSPPLPVIYEGHNDAEVEVFVDLTPEEKSKLTGSGVITVELSSLSLEFSGGTWISIPYSGRETTPQSTAVLRKKARHPMRAEEYHLGEYGFSATPKSAPAFVAADYCSVSVVGSHYETVKRYLIRAQNEFMSVGGQEREYYAANSLERHLTSELQYPESRRYSIFAGLVNNLVPERHFRKWLPYFLANPNLETVFVAASYALSLEPEELLRPSDPADLSHYGFTPTFDWIERGVDRTGRPEALRNQYLNTLGVMPNFSIQNRVPLNFFLEQEARMPADMNPGSKDFKIAGAYNKEVSVREKLAQIGLDPDSIYQGFLNDYGVKEYEMIPPAVAEVLARTYTDPLYRISQPLALVVSDDDASDGTFSDNRILAHLAKTHRLVYGQALDGNAFKSIASRGYQRHGAFDVVVSAGHGTQAASGAILFTDDALFEQLGLQMKPSATLVLASCAGDDRRGVTETLASKMRRFLFGRPILAADFPTSGIYLHYSASSNADERYRVFNLGAATLGAADLAVCPPSDIQVAASDPSGVMVHYPAASVAALDGGSLTVSYSKATGTLFPPGLTTVEVTATDGLGHRATASFNVKVRTDSPKSQNCNLFDLILSYGSLHEGIFEKEKTDYALTVPFAVKTLKITPLTEDPVAGVMVNSVAASPGEASTVPLKEGTNTFSVRVTAQGGASKTYRVLVNREASPETMRTSADLAWLDVSSSQLPAETKEVLGYDKLFPEFAAATLDYSVSVPPLADFLKLTSLPLHASARVTINGSLTSGESTSVPLAPGQNRITVALSSADGQSTRSYRLTVNRMLWSTNAKLSNLRLERAGLSEPFSAERTSYTADLAEGSPTALISALTTDDPGARTTYKGFPIGALNTLEPGVYDLLVTAQDGVSSRTYTLNVVYAAQEDAKLTGLTVSGSAFWPGLSAGETRYTVSVPHTTTALSLLPVAGRPSARVHVNGAPVAPGKWSEPVALSVGGNTVSVVVTSPNGDRLKRYTLSVNRPRASANANLSSLTLGSVGLGLTPGFTSGVSNYLAKVPHTTSSLSVIATPADSGASVQVNGVVVPKGSAGTAVALAVGNNVVKVVVTAQNGTDQKTYELNVNRAAESGLALSRLALSPAALFPAFASNITGYSATVLNSTKSVTLALESASKATTLSVNGTIVGVGSGNASIALAEGSNLIRVTVSGEVVGPPRDYEVSVFRQPSFEGSYDGMAHPSSEFSEPSQSFGVASVTVTSTGRFSGSIRLSGRNTGIPFSGFFDTTGAAMFGSSSNALPYRDIVRSGMPTVRLTMKVDFQQGLTHQLTGELSADSLVTGTLRLNRRLYTNQASPVAPLRNVPLSVLNSERENGRYTLILPAMDPSSQKRARQHYPQGAGWATGSVRATGLVTISGELADGQPVVLSNYLSKDNSLPVYAAVYAGAGSVGGELFFRDAPNESDADARGLRWFKPPSAADPRYPGGWASGLRVDLFASKFLPTNITGNTVLGNSPAAHPTVNAKLSLGHGGLASILHNNLTVGRTSVRVQGAPAGAKPAQIGLLNLGNGGQLTGRFIYPDANRTVIQLRGAVFQKTQRATGYFLAPSVGVGKLESGLLELTY